MGPAARARARRARGVPARSRGGPVRRARLRHRARPRGDLLPAAVAHPRRGGRRALPGGLLRRPRARDEGDPRRGPGGDVSATRSRAPLLRALTAGALLAPTARADGPDAGAADGGRAVASSADAGTDDPDQ